MLISRVVVDVEFLEIVPMGCIEQFVDIVFIGGLVVENGVP